MLFYSSFLRDNQQIIDKKVVKVIQQPMASSDEKGEVLSPNKKTILLLDIDFQTLDAEQRNEVIDSLALEMEEMRA